MRLSVVSQWLSLLRPSKYSHMRLWVIEQFFFTHISINYSYLISRKKGKNSGTCSMETTTVADIPVCVTYICICICDICLLWATDSFAFSNKLKITVETKCETRLFIAAEIFEIQITRWLFCWNNGGRTDQFGKMVCACKNWAKLNVSSRKIIGNIATYYISNSKYRWGGVVHGPLWIGLMHNKSINMLDSIRFSHHSRLFVHFSLWIEQWTLVKYLPFSLPLSIRSFIWPSVRSYLTLFLAKVGTHRTSYLHIKYEC